jgi:type IX secretion system PorP/SprF family membrane protein
MKKILLSLLACSMYAVNAQDIHFSQTAQTPLLINPGAAGVYDGWERVIVNHRNQWLGAGTQFMTTSVAADANFGKSRNNDKAHLGLGVLFFNDIGGDARFGAQAGAITVSGILPMGGSGHILSAGIQGGMGNRSADFNNLVFSSQWNGTSFDQTLGTGEENGTNFLYIDASAGIYYTFDGGKSGFRRNDDFKFQLGFAGFHLNRPMLRYTSVDGDRMYRKFVAHASVVSDIQNTNISVDGSVAQFFQGPHSETLLGAMLRYRFVNGTKITGLSQDAYIGIGAYYRVKDAVIPSVMINWNGFQFGVSYDVTVSSMRKAYAGGSLEFSLSYTNMSHALFKSRTKRRR